MSSAKAFEASETGAWPGGSASPLPRPAAREPMHRRVIDCVGYRREDGLWDIEGRLTDVKSYEFDNRWRGPVQPGDPIHEMHLRLTIDDDLTIHEAAARTSKSPFEICPEATPNYAGLRGLKIAPGWLRQARAQIGGTHGCTHMTELLGRMGTVAFQTVLPLRRRSKSDAERQSPPPLLDTCHALRSDGPVIRDRHPEHYTGDDPRALESNGQAASDSAD